MIIQELFQQAEKERVEEAYFLQHTVFEPYERYSLDKKVDVVMRIKGYISEYMIRLATCNIDREESQTVFIIELPCGCYELKLPTPFSVLNLDKSIL